MHISKAGREPASHAHSSPLESFMAMAPLPSPTQGMLLLTWVNVGATSRDKFEREPSGTLALTAQIRQQTGDVRLVQAGLGAGSRTMRGFFTVCRRNILILGSLSLKWMQLICFSPRSEQAEGRRNSNVLLWHLGNHKDSESSQYYGCKVLCFSRHRSSTSVHFSSTLESMSECKWQGNLDSLLSY